MTTKKLFILLLLSICFGCVSEEIKVETPQIIPKPLFQKLSDGFFVIDENTSLRVDPIFKENTKYLKDFILNSSGFDLKESNGKNTNNIILERSSVSENKEAYELIVTPEFIKISAVDNRGIFYGIQSLRQLFPPCVENSSCEQTTFKIKALTIKDKPQFKYRGMHLDVGRHFFSVKELKTYIDMLSMLKMNTFHWHLTEDQGWRIEIKEYPRLTEIGAFRKETLIGHYNDQPHQFDGERYGGFYTQEQVKEVVEYASDRQITVIPEIEMPGHSQAAIAAYPELGCTGKNVEVATTWGVFEEVYCPNQKTFAFLEDVLDEVIELFPSEYIHIGGDEAPKTRWKNCNHCQQLIKREGLKDEHELQSYFINKIERYLNKKGRQIIGWDEILEGGLAPNATVMSWRGTKGAIEAAKQGHNVIMTPTSHCYFDYYQSDNDNEPLAIGGFLPLQKVYEFNPIPEELNAEEATFVMGAQGNVWTEYMPEFKQVSYMAFPRAIALSEVVWSENENYLDFVSRLENFQKRMNFLGVTYANHLYEIEGTLITENNQLFYHLKTLLPDKTIRFTTDGSDVTSTSAIYKNPLVIDRKMILKAAVFNNENIVGSVFTQTLKYHKATGKNIEISVLPHKAYNTGGKEALVNSISGSNMRFGDKEWLGFFGEDVEILIDMDKKTTINEISTRFFNAPGQWIYAPKIIEVHVYENDLKAPPIANKILNAESNELIINSTISFSNLSARYIKLVIRNRGIIEEGQQGAGNPAWTFIDEIIIE